MISKMEGLLCDTLNNGVRLPSMGFALPTQNSSIASKALDVALAAGYRHIVIDSSTEQDLQVGLQIKRWIECRGYGRDEIFVTVKIQIEDPSHANVKSRFVQRLYSLGCDYIDLLLLDIPATRVKDEGSGLIRPASNLTDEELDNVVRIWKTIEALKTEEYLHSVGLLCANHHQLLNVLERPAVQPQVIYTEQDSKISRHYLEQLLKFCAKKKLQPIVEMTSQSLTPKNSTKYKEKLEMIAKRYSRTTKQVERRAFIQRGVAVVGKDNREDLITSGFEVFDFAMDDVDVAKLSQENDRDLSSQKNNHQVEDKPSLTNGS